MENITDYDNLDVETLELKEDRITVAELIQEKIPPKRFIGTIQAEEGSISISLKWTEMIAIVNRKLQGKKINTQIPAALLVDIYSRVMEKSFL